MTQSQTINELYVTEESQEAVALSARLTVAQIENQIEARIGKGPRPWWVVLIEYPMDLERARQERARYFRDMGWSK